MMIAGTVVILFVMGLFFSMLGQQPKSDREWQNDTEREHSATPEPLEPAPEPVPAART